MKNTLIVIVFLLSVSIFSQDTHVVESQGGLITAATFSNGGVIHNPPNDLVGSPYLFKEWDNKNFVHLVNATDEKATVKLLSINLNVQLNKFTTKIDDKTVFSFNQDYFDYVIINNRRFEFFNDFNSNSKKIYEIIGSVNDMKLVKGFSTYIIKGKVSGYQTSAPVDKIKIKSQYYIKDGDNLIKIKLKKKTILALMKDKQKEVQSFAKKEKLSFKKEKDLRAIFRFYNTL